MPGDSFDFSSVGMDVALTSGARLLLDAKFDASEVVEAFPRSTVFMGVPTYYHRMLSLPSFSKSSCRSMRLFISGSAPLSADVHREFEQRTGQRILERYGSTEAMIICSNPLMENAGPVPWVFQSRASNCALPARRTRNCRLVKSE